MLSNRLTLTENEHESMHNNFGLYNKYWKPFGELLTNMERVGFKIDREHLEKVELLATQEQHLHESTFLKWVYST